jgi:hypothetical protein
MIEKIRIGVERMIDDQIRKYVRAEVTIDDAVTASITRIAINVRGADIRAIPITPLNISARGIKFSSSYDFTVGILMDLDIQIEDKKIQTTGKIVRKEVGETQGAHETVYEYAMSFSRLSEYNQIIITSYVKKKTIDHIQRLRGR